MSKFIHQLSQRFTLASHQICPRPNFLPSTLRLSTLGLLLSFSLLTFHSCGLDVEDPTPPSPPVWVQKSLPEEWPERGIDAYESGGIFLEWETSTEVDIFAYIIYRAINYNIPDSIIDYQPIVRLEKKTIVNFEYIDNLAIPGLHYLYKIIAEDEAENMSIFSDSIGYSLLPIISPGSMNPNGLNQELPNDRILRWGYNYQLEMENYLLTIVSANGDLMCRTLFQPQVYTQWTESWQIPSTINFEVDQIYLWRVDTGAKYVNDRESVGSESHWAYFSYKGI
jgi:hypothetical protein